MRSLLVTGTDTGVGKTVVACALARALSNGRRVHPFKPAETGCREEDGELVPEDALLLRDASRSSAPLDAICPYRFEEPLAPWVAAERAGRSIELAILRDAFRRLEEAADFVIVEGAGGLLVPLRLDLSFADLARELSLPILLVVANRLGAINQALLTLEAARARGLEISGWVLNEIATDRDVAIRTNERTLESLAGAPRLTTIPRLDTGDEGDLRRIGEEIVAGLALPTPARR